jgi:uncharacterized protein YdhG (YjbR/CyaY superfamily)
MRASSAIQTPARYIAGLAAERRGIVLVVHGLIRTTAPGLGPRVAGSMIGYGRYHYRYAGGREGEAALIALASHKHHVSVYVCAADEKGYVAEQYRRRLPKVSIGKSCIRFKRLEDVDLSILRQIIRHAVRVGGMGRIGPEQ